MRNQFRAFLLFFLVVFSSVILYGLYKLILGDGDDWSGSEAFHGTRYGHAVNTVPKRVSSGDPVILWWTPFTGQVGARRRCGSHYCYITQNRHFQTHPQTKVFMFYGTDFKADDIPLPREPRHLWALLHEESPKNNYLFSHEDVLVFFNYTATFRQKSDFPLTLLYLESLEYLTSSEFVVPIEKKNELLNVLAPIVYVHSDCDTPSGRDEYVQELMKYIKIDSYGKCLHNIDLPKHLEDPVDGMHHKDFYGILANYKFMLTFENAVCDDYITEKLWRSLHLGVVPIYHGATNVQDWLPDENSVINVDDFPTPESLAEFLQQLNTDDEQYLSYLSFKKNGVKNQRLSNAMKQRKWGINNDFEKGNFVEHYECFVCEMAHKHTGTHIASLEHYGCPGPEQTGLNGVVQSLWKNIYDQSVIEAKAFQQLTQRNSVYSSQEFYDLVGNLLANQD